MPGFRCVKNGQIYELQEAFVVNLREYDDNGRYMPAIECACIGNNEMDVGPLYEIAEKVCICVATQEPGSDAGFLDLEDENKNIFHISSRCIILDVQKQIAITIGLAGQKNACGILMHGIAQAQGKPISPVTEKLLNCHRPLSDYDRLQFALSMIASGNAVIETDSEEELAKMQELRLVRPSFLAQGITKVYNRYTINEMGFLLPVKSKQQNWDRIYTAESINKLAQSLIDNHTLGLSKLRPQPEQV